MKTFFSIKKELRARVDLSFRKFIPWILNIQNAWEASLLQWELSAPFHPFVIYIWAYLRKWILNERKPKGGKFLRDNWGLFMFDVISVAGRYVFRKVKVFRFTLLTARKNQRKTWMEIIVFFSFCPRLARKFSNWKTRQIIHNKISLNFILLLRFLFFCVCKNYNPFIKTFLTNEI